MTGNEENGPLAWMAKNRIASNVLMLILVVGGVVTLGTGIKQEVFPEVELEQIVVTVPYPGASPAEVEQAIVLVVEEAVQGVDGVKDVRSVAAEGSATVILQLLLGSDTRQAFSDVKSVVGRISSFPADAERPNVRLVSTRRQVISLVLYGDVAETTLRSAANRTRDALLRDERITSVELSGVRPLEISVEVPQASLRKHGLTLTGIARRIREASVELPGGALQTESGELLLRTAERRDQGPEFADIVVLSRPDGSRVRVRDIAQVKDGFRDNHQNATFNGKPAAMINVFRVGDQTPLEIAAAVKEHVSELKRRLPKGLGVATWVDRSEMYEGRIELLLDNALIGLLLVLLILGLFLQARLAFWVTLGIPVSFAGSLLLFPIADVSINMLSLFGFILALGMVVDDAIVVGEAIYKHRADGKPRLQAAIDGAREVAKPVVFSVLTTCVAFMPMLFVPGVAGKFFRVVPLVVISVLLMSLAESLFVLPAHLSHPMPWLLRVVLAPYLCLMQLLAKLDMPRRLERHVQRVYAPLLAKVLDWRYFTVSAGVALFILTAGFAIGRVPLRFIPNLEGDLITVQLRMPPGTPAWDTERAANRVASSARLIMEVERANSKDLLGVSRGLFTQVGARVSVGPDSNGPAGKEGSHLATVMVYLVDADDRDIATDEFVRRWRTVAGEIAGVESMVFSHGEGIRAGRPIHIDLMHDDVDTLETAAIRLARDISVYRGLGDIESGVARGKEQLDFRLTDLGRSQGLTELDLARQVRGAFFGAEAVRQQRGRDEVRTYVRLPLEERRSLYNVQRLMVRTPAGGEMPVARAADVTRGRAHTVIHRSNGRRTIAVTAGLAHERANAGSITGSILENELAKLLAAVPGLEYRPGGELERQADAMGSLFIGFVMAHIVMFSILAVAFRSYLQPLLVMSAIPFGMIGAVWGHALMGVEISLVSLMGLVALSGVVCNDSLILIDAVNQNREAGMAPIDAVIRGCTRRFRPIVLTSLTTFFGLAPIILEKSAQASFLVPMAVSLGFGILAATFIMLLIVPSCYLILEDLIAATRSVATHLRERPTIIPAPIRNVSSHAAE
ncbi:MAG: efflux RND transporter permease subunit [Myxococcales bacterium]|nr:efflux RND transporter permease subunit [Myxococcales bacterium]